MKGPIPDWFWRLVALCQFLTSNKLTTADQYPDARLESEKYSISFYTFKMSICKSTYEDIQVYYFNHRHSFSTVKISCIYTLAVIPERYFLARASCH